MKLLPVLALASIVLLSGCSSREDADQKLVKGCEAGAKALLAQDQYDRQIRDLGDADFATEDKQRSVRIETVMKNKAYGYDTSEVVVCVFNEKSGPSFLGWKAELERITVGEDVFGRVGNTIKGDLEDFDRLKATVAAALK